MDTQFEKLIKEVETDLGRPMDVGEEIETKALFYFAKGVELKDQLESEPQHIRDILPGVMANIRSQMQKQSKHRRRVVSAVADYICRGSRPVKKQTKIAVKQRVL